MNFCRFKCHWNACASSALQGPHPVLRPALRFAASTVTLRFFLKSPGSKGGPRSSSLGAPQVRLEVLEHGLA
eukprot:CAMPEP_0175209514 /NCGR_PEP_ID=MMETSP0093-20121207/14173_1 /TAXON_ID=311494 /ORGANISM="Alexandrium monilatum, Strain CCMP3105" /LENGTH=71 /DNA_ID=CAMNT_0016502723 /DNA_START=78 /DNA_END=289 /DNA_ORIENTATION=+